MRRTALKVVLAALGLVMTGVVGAPAQAEDYPPAGACGGDYAVSVGAGYVHDPTSASSYSYCSDGTLQDAGVEPTHDGTSSCGGRYAVTVEAESIDLPAGPFQSVSYCSDGTIDGVKDAVPDSHDECGGVWVTATLTGDPTLTVGGECEAGLAGATTVSGQADVDLGTTLGGSMSGSVTLEIKDQDNNLLASCSDSKTGVAFADWAGGDRPSCSTGDIDITGQGVTDITCSVTDSNRGTGTYGCALS